MGGISFLNAGLLFLAAATILPLLIWLLAKKKPKRIVFSTLRFIKASQEQEKKRTRLKNIILLIIRMLIILLLALAVSRPLLQSKRLKPSRKHPPTALAILLDTSFSMDYVQEGMSTLDRAKDALRQINSLCNDEDRLILITSDDAWNRLHAQIYAGRIPQDSIDRIGVSFDPLPLTDMAQLAQSKLAETQLANREAYLITDGQRQEYPELPELNLRVIDLFPDGDFANLSCHSAQVQAQLVEKSRRQSIEFVLSNHGSQDRKEVLVKVVLDDAKVAEKFVDVPARQSVKETIVIELRQDGWQSGYVEVMDDRLIHDNRAHFAFPFRLDPHIAVISAKPQLPGFLRSSLSVYAGDQGRIVRLDPRQVSLGTLNQYQTIVFYAPGQLSPKLREIIGSLQKSGRGALFCLDRGLTPDYKAVLEQTFGLRIGAFREQPKSISYVNKHHFITSLMADKNLRHREIRDYWSVSGSGAANLLGGGSDIFALAKENLVLWSFDLASPTNSFFLDAAYAVLAYRSLEYVSAAIATGETRKIGDMVSASSITLPDGSAIELASRSHRLSSPGLYTLSQPEGPGTVIAVDHDQSESDFENMDLAALKYIKVLPDKWQDTLFHTRLGHDLWKWLLGAALLLLALEIILVKAEELRPNAASAPNTEGGEK